MSTSRFHRIPIRAPVTLVVFAIIALAGSSLFIVRSNIGSTTTTGASPQVKKKKIQPDLPGTIDGASDPWSIPDVVAYELFMRSIADYPSVAVLKDSGLNEDQITNVLHYAESFEATISTMDRAARELKASGSANAQLAKLQKEKEQFLARGLNSVLPKTLGAGGGVKFRSHLNTRVKPHAKKLPGQVARNDADRRLPATLGPHLRPDIMRRRSTAAESMCFATPGKTARTSMAQGRSPQNTATTTSIWLQPQ